MSNKQLTPRIRFKGFNDDWEQRKVGDIAEVVSGGTPDTNNSDYWEGDINWYAPAEISDQIYVLESERKITELGLQKSSAKMLPAEKTILFTSRAGIGKMAILGHSACTNQGFQSLVLKDGYVPYFVYSMGKQLKEKAEAVASGSTFLEISGKMLANLDVMMPNKEEQMKIASYFQSLDNLITLHQRNVDKLLKLKQALLEKMFPLDDEVVPQIRFKGFNNDWEQRKLGDNNVITMGQSPDGSTYSNTPTNFILVQGNADLVNGWVFPRIWTSQITKKCEVGDFIMSVRAPAGTMGKTAFNAVIGRGVAAIKGKEFVFQSLVRMDLNGYWNKYSTGSTFESLNSDAIKNATIQIPSALEQDKIGLMLINLDNLITLHQRKVDKFKKTKQALLEKMFV